MTGRFPSCILERIEPPATFPLTANIGVLDPMLGERDTTQKAKHPLEIDRFEDPAVKVDGEFGSICFEEGRRNGKDRDTPVHSFEGGRNVFDRRFVFANSSSRFTTVHYRHPIRVARGVSVQLRLDIA